MKLVFLLGALCLLAVINAQQAEKVEAVEEESANDYSSEPKRQGHHEKKYTKGHKSHHYHKKQKSLDSVEDKVVAKHLHESKKLKHVSKSAPHEIPPQEAELQSDLHTSKKHIKKQHVKNDQEDLHLQDLAFEENMRQGIKSPHQYQRGHHKNSHHFAHNKDAKAEQNTFPSEEKLFADQTPKEHIPKSSPPVLEDSFEALNEDKVKKNKEAKKHNKQSSKHKKAYDKVKEKTGKKEKRNKKYKKDKKQKHW